MYLRIDTNKVENGLVVSITHAESGQEPATISYVFNSYSDYLKYMGDIHREFIRGFKGKDGIDTKKEPEKES